MAAAFEHDSLKRFYEGISALKCRGMDLCDEANAKILDEMFTSSNIPVAIHELPEDMATLTSYYREDHGLYFFLSPMHYKLQEIPAYEERGLRLRPAAYLVKQPAPMIFRESVVRQAKALHAAAKDLKYVFIGACSRPELANKELNSERRQFIDQPDSDRAAIRTWNDLQIFRRAWVVEFAKKRFTSDCLFKDTACSGNATLGPFDVSHDASHGVFLEQDVEYLRTMCRGQFTLCPGGDQPWSYRFFEAIMCKSIPIVENYFSTGRNQVEREIGYRYFKVDEEHEFREEWVEENWRLFCAHHLLPGAKI